LIAEAEKIIDSTWRSRLKSEMELSYFAELNHFLNVQMSLGKTIYPARENWFAALGATPFDKVKVVIVGQDPYHGEGQAHGLSFSVPNGVAHPPSLQNIFKELRDDLGVAIPKSGSLRGWAEQGVLLLNSVLTVEADQAASHEGKGWEKFTDKIIRHLNDETEGLVFILWGAYAQKKASFVDSKKHLVLKSPHPSPLSSYRGFFGSKPFSKANEYLRQNGRDSVNWSLTETTHSSDNKVIFAKET
jgi:uracil-DNA glycosylase